MIGAPEGANNIHLDVLARLSTLLMDENFRKSLISAKSPGDFISLIDKKEKTKNLGLKKMIHLTKIHPFQKCLLLQRVQQE